MKPVFLLTLLALTLQPGFAQSEENHLRSAEPQSVLKGRLDHACIRVTDIDRSVEFYRETFGLMVKTSFVFGPDGERIEIIHYDQ